MDWRERAMCQDVRRAPMGLTAKQAEYLTAIHDIAAAQGYPPNTIEVGAYLNVNPNTVSRHLAALRRKGYVQQPDGKKNRQTRLTDKARALFGEAR